MSYYPATPLQGIYATEMYTYVHQKTNRRIFIKAPFIIVRIWKQPNYTHHNKLYNTTVKYYTVMKSEQRGEHRWIL